MPHGVDRPSRCGISPTVVEDTHTILAGVGLVWAGVLAACTLLNVVAAVVLARLSLPRRLQSRVEAVEERTRTQDKQLAEFAAQSAAWESTLRGLVDEAEDAFARTERKRASAAATLSRLDQRQGGNGAQLMTREAIIAAARAKDSGL